MVRPREFDEAEVLENVTTAFWTTGYAGTSVSALMDATGLAKGSLYKAFGDKRSLFLHVLRGFIEEGQAFLRTQLLPDPSRTAVDKLTIILDFTVGMATGREKNRGCFVVNSATELAEQDTEVADILKAHKSAVHDCLRLLIVQGMQEGSLRPDLDPDGAAHLLALFIDGLQVHSHLDLPPEKADRTLRSLLHLIRVDPEHPEPPLHSTNPPTQDAS